MKKTDDTPLVVYLAFSSIETRKGALILISCCLLFTIYCIPWVNYFNDNFWVAQILLIDNWEWFAMMLPMTTWYWLSLKWVDKNEAWWKQP